ncbi:MAG: ATP-binding protein [Vulcanococcus sp.]
MLRAAITALRPRLDAASVRCVLEGFDLPAPLLGNQVQLRIACGNLLVNSLEALDGCPPPQRRILVRLERSGATSLTLLVADSGPGLQGRSLRSLSLASSKSEGMGLGLFTTALIAEQHHGSLAAGASSELGGAELRLVLPCLPPSPQPQLSSERSRSDAVTPPAPVQRR